MYYNNYTLYFTIFYYQRNIIRSLENKKVDRKISCLNCQHSYRRKDGILYCWKHHTTSVCDSENCEDYQVFIKNKETIIKEINRIIYSVKDDTK